VKELLIIRANKPKEIIPESAIEIPTIIKTIIAELDIKHKIPRIHAETALNK
jgi:hypothetical protein